MQRYSQSAINWSISHTTMAPFNSINKKIHLTSPNIQRYCCVITFIELDKNRSSRSLLDILYIIEILRKSEGKLIFFFYKIIYISLLKPTHTLEKVLLNVLISNFKGYSQLDRKMLHSTKQIKVLLLLNGPTNKANCCNQLKW